MIAMVSAGIVEHVTNQLDQGKRELVKLSKNDCMNINLRRPRNPEEYVSVHDCNADVVKGEIQAREMMLTWIHSLKANEKEMQMNEHNAAVGRMVSFFFHFIFMYTALIQGCIKIYFKHFL